jgi:strictosidine synthase
MELASLRKEAVAFVGQVVVAAGLRPERWTPPRSPGLAGIYQTNRALAAGERWPTGGVGPEDVVVDPAGRAYVGLEDGRILRFPAGGGAPTTVADTRGRPLGLELDGEGRLIICDARRGLLRMDGAGAGGLEVLVDAYQGRRLRFTNNAAVARDGTIYFSDSSTAHDIGHYRADILDHRPRGRLFVHDPAARSTRLLLDQLYFANGVALDADESFVLVAETSAYRICRLWLTGPRAGAHEVFIDNLPGFPDNLSTSADGLFWLALPTPRDRTLDFLLPRPRLRHLVAFLPERLQPQPARHGFVLALDADGRVVHNLQDATGACAMVTGARVHDGYLYLGSLTEPALVRHRL